MNLKGEQINATTTDGNIKKSKAPATVNKNQCVQIQKSKNQTKIKKVTKTKIKSEKDQQNQTTNNTVQKKKHTVKILNMNVIKSVDIEAKVLGQTSEITGTFIDGNRRTEKMGLLLDSGALFSAIHAETLDTMGKTKFPYKLIKTQRPTPSSASNHELTVLGDVILNVEFDGPDGKLRIMNIRFTVLKELSCKIIIGQEVLASLDFKSSGSIVWIDDYRFQLMNTQPVIQLDLIDAVTVTNEEMPVTVATMKATIDPLVVRSNKKYLLNPVLPEHMKLRGEHGNGPPLIPYGLGSINLASLLVPGGELETTQNLIFAQELDEIPTRITCTLEEIINKAEINSDFYDSVINSLQDRKDLVSDQIINELVDKTDFNEDYKPKFRKLLEEFRFAFSVDDIDVGAYQAEEIKIELANETPVYVRPRRIAYSLRDYVESTVLDMEKKGIIEKSEGSGWNSPIHMVKKKNGKYRMTIDYREVNKRIQPNRFPIPRCREMFDKLTKSKYFSAFDLRAGYWNIRIQEPYRDVTTFTVADRQYRWVSMPMGLKISGNIFQRIMNQIIGDDINKGMAIYLDDVICYAATQDELIKLMRKVFEKFSRAGILLNPTKCHFGKKELDYLGFTISEHGFRPQLDKTLAIREYPKPTDKKGLKRFLGMCQFYAETVPNLQLAMGPLHQITGKTKDFAWTDEIDESFQKVKNLLANSVTLAYPRLGEQDRLILTTDASETGYGCVLSEIGEDQIERPLGFSSGTFRGAQERWKIVEKECYALVQGLEYFYVYLYGRRFTCRTDNYSLSFLRSTTFTKKNGSSNWKTLRWIDFIQSFDFDCEHFNGSKEEMYPADALSRATGSEIVALADLNTISMKKPFWVKHGICLADVIEAQNNEMEQILAKSGPYSKIRKIVKKEELIYVKMKAKQTERLLLPVSLENKFLEYIHLPNHLAIKNMEGRIINSGIHLCDLRNRIRQYVGQCETCVSIKPKNRAKTAATMTTTANHPWSLLEADLIGPMPKTLKGNTYILTVIDIYSRWVELRPLRNKTTKEVADKLLDIFYIRGPPLNVQFDNDPALQSAMMTNLLRDMGIYQQKICPYRPQSNAKVESANFRVKMKLQLWDSEGITWDDDLAPIQLSINLERIPHLNSSPFQRLHGYLLQEPSFVDLDNEQQTELTSTGWSRTAYVKMARAISENYMTEQAAKLHNFNKNEGSQTFKQLKPGDKVLRYFNQPPGASAKFWRSWKGVFIVKEVIDKNTYVVASEDLPRKKFICHRHRLRRLGPMISEEPAELVPPAVSIEPQSMDHLDDAGSGTATASNDNVNAEATVGGETKREDNRKDRSEPTGEGVQPADGTQNPTTRITSDNIKREPIQKLPRRSKRLANKRQKSTGEVNNKPRIRE